MKLHRVLTALTLILSLLVPLLVPAPAAHSAPLPQGAAWYDADWSYRKPVAIDHTSVPADLSDFPVLISLAADAELAAAAQDDGDDILFTDAAGTKLRHELERFNGVTGELIAWVRVPYLSAAADTRLYAYYGNGSAAAQADPAGAWDANFVMVHHLEETTGIHDDSTANNNDGMPQNGLVQNAAGKVGGADDFGGVNQFIDVGTGASLDAFGPNQDFSVFMWARRDDASKVQGLFSAGSSAANGIYFGTAYQNYDDLRFLSPGNTFDLQSTSGAVGDTAWHYVGLTADRDGAMTFWVDGSPVASASMAAHAAANWNRKNDTYKIGTDRSESGPMDGIIDEVRVSKVARSAAWIAAEYATANNPASFFHVGGQQAANTPVVADESPADGAAGVSVALHELSFYLEDPDGDSLDFSVSTTPDVGSRSETGVGAGTYTVPISGLEYGATYRWTVDVTDGAHPVHREFTFTTETNVPAISNENPPDGSGHVALNPTLRADIADPQGDAVEWGVAVSLGGTWQAAGSGTLSTGVGTVSAQTSGVEEYDTAYSWRVRARDAGSGTWVEEVYTFRTVRNEVSFAAFTDSHIGGMIETSWGMAEHLDSLAQDLMNETAPIDFVVHLGDIIMHSTAYVEGEGLPSRYDQYKNNFNAYLLQHVNVPFIAVPGNHDLNDYYGESHAGYPHNGDDPFNLVRAFIDATEMNSYPYAFMKNNILFIALPETDYHHYTKPTIYEYVEYMTRRYPDATTIIFSHQAIEDTTIHDGGYGTGNTYRGKQDRQWWADLFRRNPQIKMWIHGHQHMLDWYQSDHSNGGTFPVEDFGHEMVFSMPYSQADWGNYFEEDRTVIYSISSGGIRARAWENNGAGGHWVPDYDHEWAIETTYDESARDWYSFPVFMQDGEVQLTDMKVFSPKMTLELVGTQPMELFYDPTMATRGTSWGGENVLGFGDDEYADVIPRLPGMTVHGPADLDFPPKYPGSAFQGGGSAYHEDGRTGQPYHFFPVGTTHAAVPGATYQVAITARSASGAGRLTVDMSVSDWGTGSQHSTLAGSTQRVIEHTFGTGYETVTGTYTVPEDENAWFLQGYLDFLDGTDYDVSLFSIKRLGESNTTDNFGLSLNGTWYRHSGVLQQYERAEFALDPTTLADQDGVIEITADIGGNRFGMAHIIYHAPLLMGRNARFTVDNVSGNQVSLTLQRDLSYYSNTFKMFPFSRKYGTFLVTSDNGSAARRTSANGNQWIESSTPAAGDTVTLGIVYGMDAPDITHESPAHLSTGVSPNPTLSAYVNDLQGNPVVWQIRAQVGGVWQVIGSGTLSEGEGTVSATPTQMGAYNTTYSWSVRATDAVSGEITERIYQFTTRPENYSPVLSNPEPPDGAADLPPNPTLSVDVSDPDGDLLDVVFETDASGTWTEIARYTGVGDGAYSTTPTTLGSYATTYHWRATVDDGRDAVSATYSFTTHGAAGSWWDHDWLYRKQIVVDHSLTDEDLTDFPVLIDITDADLAAYARAEGGDIHFTDLYGVGLSHEIESYDPATGHLLVWVKVPHLSASQDTLLYMYFGNPAAENQEDAAGTWEAGYVMVQHLAEASGTHFDSTANANHGTTVVVTDQDADGIIDGADEFDGADDYVRVPNAASLQFGEGSLTAEAWIYPQSVPDASGGGRVINNRGTGPAGSYKGYQVKIKRLTGGWNFGDSGIDDATGNYKVYNGIAAYTLNQWHHVAMVYQADNQLAFYVDGVLDVALPVANYGSLTNSLPTAIGASIADQGTEGSIRQLFDGIIDEVRLSNVARSAAWLAAGYRNQSDPAAYHDTGDLEVGRGPAEVWDPVPADGARDVSLSLAELTFRLRDPDGEPMDYSVTITPGVGRGAAHGVGDGTYQVPISGLEYGVTYTWTVRVDDGTDVTEATYSFTTERQAGLWHDPAWRYRKEIVIDHTQVAEDLADFPVLISLPADADLVALAQADGDDLLFTDVYGDKLDHEIEIYQGATGALIAWVRVPFVSSTQDTVLYLYYGNPGADDQQNPAGVWDEHYVMVHHLAETAGTHFDSTAFQNHATTVVVTNQSAAGRIDGADELDGADDYLRVPNAASLQFGEGSFTAEAWIYPQSVPDASGGARIINNRGTGTGGSYRGYQFKIARAGTGQWKFKDSAIDDGAGIYKAYEGTPTYALNGWHQVVMVYDADNQLIFYADGSLDGALPVGSYGSLTNSLPTAVGAAIANQGAEGTRRQFFDGIIDEVRLSDIARSAGWLETQYNNQSDPGSFLQVGDEELVPLPPHAQDDGTETPEDTPVLIDVAGNDSDENGDLDPASASPISGPDYGSLQAHGDGTFTYTPDADFNGIDRFDYQIDDMGGLTATATVAITITAINDAPVNRVPGAQAVQINTSLTFSAAGGNPIAIDDVDAGAGELAVALMTISGTLTLSGTDGLVFGTGDGTADADMAFTGTLTNVNAALDGLRFDPPLDYVGSTALTITADDQGHTGSGGPLSDADTLAIQVESAPTNALYLPMVTNYFLPGPDLRVEALVATSSGVTVTLMNAGDCPTGEDFWVDVYFNPTVVPGLNQPWDTIAGHGIVWGVTDSVPAGGRLMLTAGGEYYFPEYSSPAPLPVGARVYVLVDSISYDTEYGAVWESNEANNVFGPVVSTASGAGQGASSAGHVRPATWGGLPER